MSRMSVSVETYITLLRTHALPWRVACSGREDADWGKRRLRRPLNYHLALLWYHNVNNNPRSGACDFLLQIVKPHLAPRDSEPRLNLSGRTWREQPLTWATTVAPLLLLVFWKMVELHQIAPRAKLHQRVQNYKICVLLSGVFLICWRDALVCRDWRFQTPLVLTCSLENFGTLGWITATRAKLHECTQNLSP